jgi:hypothetical protein
MTFMVLSSVGVAGILAHLLLIGASLVLKGVALKHTSRPDRFALLAGGTVPDVFVADSVGGNGLLGSMLGLLVRKDQVGVFIKKFSHRNLPAGQFIALNGEAGYQADTLSRPSLATRRTTRGEATPLLPMNRFRRFAAVAGASAVVGLIAITLAASEGAPSSASSTECGLPAFVFVPLVSLPVLQALLQP